MIFPIVATTFRPGIDPVGHEDIPSTRQVAIRDRFTGNDVILDQIAEDTPLLIDVQPQPGDDIKIEPVKSPVRRGEDGPHFQIVTIGVDGIQNRAEIGFAVPAIIVFGIFIVLAVAIIPSVVAIIVVVFIVLIVIAVAIIPALQITHCRRRGVERLLVFEVLVSSSRQIMFAMLFSD